MSAQPQVWISSFAGYNSMNNFAGSWFDAIDCPQDSREFCQAMVDKGRGIKFCTGEESERAVAFHEELWCFDHQGFEGLLTGECSPMEAKRLAELIEAIEADQVDVKAVAAWMDYDGDRNGKTWADLRSDFEDSYRGDYKSLADYAQEYAEETIERLDDAQWPFNYIDWERAGRALVEDSHVARSDNGIYVFSL